MKGPVVVVPQELYDRVLRALENDVFARPSTDEVLDDDFVVTTFGPNPLAEELRAVVSYEPDNHHNAALCPYCSPKEWEPTRWWRSTLADGSVWTETSDEDELREHAKRAVGEVTFWRLMKVRDEKRWEKVT